MTVKKPSGRKRGEVTADDVVAVAIGIVDRPPQSDDRIEESDEVDHRGLT